MRISPFWAALVIVIGHVALSVGASGPAPQQEGADLYDWLVREEVPTTDVILAAPDAEALARSRIQDEQRYKVGLTVPLDVTIAPGKARASAGGASRNLARGALRLRRDGFVWSAIVESPGAASLRLGFEDFYLGEGVELYLYNDLGQVDGPYSRTGRRGHRSFFTRTLATDRVHLQLRYDGPVVAATLDSIALKLSGVAHIDERFLIGRAPTLGDDRAHCANLNAACVENAECNLQAPPDDTIVEMLKHGGVDMFFQSGASWYLCSGGLIGSSTPGHLLTAHHCISTPSEAASLESSFDFTTP